MQAKSEMPMVKERIGKHGRILKSVQQQQKHCENIVYLANESKCGIYTGR